MNYRNGKVIGWNNALQALAAGGVKDDKTSLRLTRMILFIQDHAEEVLMRRDILLRGLARMDEDNKPLTTGEGNQQEIVFENKFAAEAELNDFARAEDVEIDPAKFPKPFTWEELHNTKLFKKTPTPDLIAALGPFVKLPAEDAE